MMIDNAFPNALGFLEAYTRGISKYSQSGDEIPALQLENEYAKQFGGPLISRTIRYSPPNAILKTPHLDSPYMDQLIKRGFKPLKAPTPIKSPQLPYFV